MLPLPKYFRATAPSATLAFFRLAFGLMMLGSTLRFVAKGWVYDFYIKPDFHFKYYGFEWVQPFGVWTYGLFAVCALSALMLALGYKYKLAATAFFLSFTYIELLDKTTYLNHYYFVSVVAFVLIFLPANASYSLDARINPNRSFQYIPRWNIDILKLLLGIVYFYAGLAKLNSDWLLEAMPLRIWLPNNAQLPILGKIISQTWAAYAFSWAGLLYDLSIPFLLLYKPTRRVAFVFVVVFHVLTRILFPIGVFPYVMIISTLVFFEAGWHETVLQRIFRWFKWPAEIFKNGKTLLPGAGFSRRFKMATLGVLLLFQLLFPFRYWAYPGELFWTEEGFRFSWRVMLMEKAGYTQFRVVDGQSGKSQIIDNSNYLTAFQEKQMAFQPDFILEYAHYLAHTFQQSGWHDPQVYVESYVALNGRLSQRYIDPKINLAQQRESFAHKTWILPFNDEIHGL